MTASPMRREVPLVDSVRRLVDRGRAAAETRHLIAECNVLVRYTDLALAEVLSRATRHLVAAASGGSDLTIDCVTDPSVARRAPADWPTVGTVYGDDGSTAFTWDPPEGPLYVYDRTRRHGWAVFSSPDAVPTWDQATPFRQILQWWSVDRGLQLIHAAAVGHDSAGLLLVGRSGSGKSTTALACLEAGLGFAADDYCLLSPGDPPRVYSLYLSAKADARAAMLLPGLREPLTKSPLSTWGKSVLFADEIRPDAVSGGFPVHGIVVPRLTGDATSRLSRLSPAAALRALAPSTLLQMPGNHSAGLAAMAEIVRDLPAWELTLGSPGDGATAIKELLDQRATT